MSVAELKKKLKPLCKDYGISYLAIFGSYAREEQKQRSDLDLLVSFEEKLSLWDVIGVEQELSKKMGIRVDLVTKGSLSSAIKEYVVNDLKVVYEK